MSDTPGPGDESPWDAASAADLIGKTLLIGLTRLDASGSATFLRRGDELERVSITIR